jgi:hypothetical protein
VVSVADSHGRNLGFVDWISPYAPELFSSTADRESGRSLYVSLQCWNLCTLLPYCCRSALSTILYIYDVAFKK